MLIRHRLALFRKSCPTIARWSSYISAYSFGEMVMVCLSIYDGADAKGRASQ